MKKCELCNSAAKMYCESDEASLCWDCDTRVHTANFLVAKHLRILLCHSCQSPTPWTASGPYLGHTVSVCQSCSANRRITSNNTVSSDGDHHENIEHDDSDQDDQDDQDDDDQEEDDDEGSDDDDGDNQVVPLSSTPLPPTLISSSSCSEDSSIRSSRIGFFSNNSNQNGRFSYDSIETSRQMGDYKIMSSRTTR